MEMQRNRPTETELLRFRRSGPEAWQEAGNRSAFTPRDEQMCSVPRQRCNTFRTEERSGSLERIWTLLSSSSTQVELTLPSQIEGLIHSSGRTDVFGP